MSQTFRNRTKKTEIFFSQVHFFSSVLKGERVFSEGKTKVLLSKIHKKQVHFFRCQVFNRVHGTKTVWFAKKGTERFDFRYCTFVRDRCVQFFLPNYGPKCVTITQFIKRHQLIERKEVLGETWPGVQGSLGSNLQSTTIWKTWWTMMGSVFFCYPNFSFRKKSFVF